MDKNKIKEIRDGAIDVLNQYMAQFGYAEDQTGVTYENDGSGFTLRVHFTTTDDDKKEKRQKQDFESLCRSYGFEPSDYKMRIVDQKQTLCLIGFNPKARRYPCILVDEKTGKQFSAPIPYIKAQQKTSL